MKSALRIILSIMLLLVSGFPFVGKAAVQVTKNATLHKMPPTDSEPTDPEEKGMRKPSCPYYCVVSELGVSIAGIDKCDILSYEVWSVDEECLVSFSDESEFAMYVLNNSTMCGIVIRFESYTLQGILND